MNTCSEYAIWRDGTRAYCTRPVDHEGAHTVEFSTPNPLLGELSRMGQEQGVSGFVETRASEEPIQDVWSGNPDTDKYWRD